MKRPRDSQRSKLYGAERVVPGGDQFVSVEECQAYVDRITASAWWCTYQVPWIDKDPPTGRSLVSSCGTLTVQLHERSPATRLGWGSKSKKPPKRAKGIIPCRDESKPVVHVLDGRGRSSACAYADVIKLPCWARCERVILHELSHIIQTENPGHGRQFARIFLDITKRFHSNREAWITLKAAYKKHKVRWKKKRKVSPDNPGLRKFREIAAARRENGKTS